MIDSNPYLHPFFLAIGGSAKMICVGDLTEAGTCEKIVKEATGL